MKRTAHFSMILITATGISLAQTQTPGGWRRAGDPVPAQAQAQPPAQEPVTSAGLDQDPSQPVARADEYGQAQVQVPQSQPQGPAMRRYEPPPPYGLPEWVTIPAGTFVTVRVNQPLSSDRNQTGDFFTATLMQPVVVNGIVVAQRGQTVTGKVAEAKKAGRGSGLSRLALQLNGLTVADGTQATMQSSLFSRNGQGRTGRDVATVGTTTAVGAAVGAAADWGRGAAIGAGAGAAAGIIGVLLTRGQETVVFPESLLTFRIENPVNVNLSKAPQAFQFVGPNDYDQPVETQLARRPPPPRPYGGYGGYGGYGPTVSPYPYGGYPYGGYYPYYGGVGVGVVIRSGGRYGRRW